MFDFSLIDNINRIIREGARDRMNELEFMEKEISFFLGSPERRLMIDGCRYYKGEQDILRKQRTAIGEDLDKAELAEDGTIKGLDAQLKTLKGAEDSKFLFSEKKVTIRGANPGEAGDINPDGRETDPAKMSYEDFVAQAKENPEG